MYMTITPGSFYPERVVGIRAYIDFFSIRASCTLPEVEENSYISKKIFILVVAEMRSKLVFKHVNCFQFKVIYLICIIAIMNPGVVGNNLFIFSNIYLQAHPEQ